MTKNQKGFTLIEAMIAIGLIVTGLTGVLVLINRAIGFNSLAFNRLVASSLAQEGVEVVRNIRDTNWLNQRPWDNGLPEGTYQVQYNSKQLSLYTDQPLLFDENTGFFNYESGSSTPYKRKIELKRISADEIRVLVTVSWIGRGGGDFNLVVEDHLFNWF